MRGLVCVVVGAERGQLGGVANVQAVVSCGGVGGVRVRVRARARARARVGVRVGVRVMNLRRARGRPG